jgi:hypothetical protein
LIYNSRFFEIAPVFCGDNQNREEKSMEKVFRTNVLFYEYVIYGIFERFTNFVFGLFKNVEITKTVAFGFTAWKTVNFVYDILIFAFVLAKFGWVGVPFLMAGAGFLCWITILIYDSTGVDFIGIESAKKEMTIFKEKLVVWIESLDERPGQKVRLPFLKVKIKYDAESIRLALSKVWIVEFLICTFNADATVTTIYLRERAFGGLTRRDWKIFWASVVISCLYWSVIVLAGISVYECSEELVVAILLAIWNK